jgi:jumonji domain-containing protein 2
LVIKGKQGIYTITSSKKRSISVSDFKALIKSSSDNQAPDAFDYNKVERKYWKSKNFGTTIYGADVMGSIMNVDVCINFS